ncbi:MAG: sigma-54-dependent Fis family transcriptional regulator [Cyclobacteriaceae bacterium]
MSKIEASILIVDDDAAVLTSAKLLLKQRYQYVHALSGTENLDNVLNETPFDLVLLDMNYSAGNSDGSEGLDIMKQISNQYPNIDIIPITAYGEIDLVVHAMKLGARDFITKPWNNHRIYATLDNLLDLRSTANQLSLLKAVSQYDQTNHLLIGKSRPFLKALGDLEKVAKTDASVLLKGENGTGKTVFAHHIHQTSPRNTNNLITVDLGSLPETLFENELFGHVKGAYTDAKEDKPGVFELANNSTLFLDEISNINLVQQAKLLSVLQNQEVSRVGSHHKIGVDIRLICATNNDVNDSSLFRQDLLYRINTVEINIPSLRDRKEDIPLLANHFLNQFKSRYNKPKLKLDNASLNSLQNYHWPGNIRELEHTIEKAVILADDRLTPQSFSLGGEDNFNDTLNIAEMEKRLILKSLEKNKGNITHAANDLGIDRQALYRRLEKYGL